MKSANRVSKDIKHSPIYAMDDSTLIIFGDTTTQRKSCPKSTFLGLCETGLGKGAQPRKYTRYKKNKTYVDILVK
ncbi:DUF6979 family protein [Petrocella sp. FN5]|uniref:DUF6979 family protein n=1 Tax=Petrocella sp. FN5 TaxID=3032002 RepID=UPI003FA6EEC4